MDESRNLSPPIRAKTGKMAQDLGENLVGCHQTNGPERPVERRNSGMEGVAREDQRDPIERIGEERARHERGYSGRFGVPYR